MARESESVRHAGGRFASVLDAGDAASHYVPDNEFYSVVAAILRETDWTEPWLVGLLSFHVFNVIVALFARRHSTFQATYFCVLMVLAYSTEHLNKWAVDNWQQFSAKAYFDVHGLFISTVFAGPLLLTSLLFVVVWMKTAADLLVKVKRAELRTRARAARSDGAQTAAGASSAGSGSQSIATNAESKKSQ
ncbi:hypothetical protein CAOG_04445 [Capsaspora owczarzaki ATCC 30864]|uniref:Uncharacterized protein n=1 Tax=Capsaspora owczarzaki (strain ATCC 30864) TaxID=595528 RepID=A0A0D2UF21_CAPO3|nr:hypothetical protein CAOG_04445 [Capsaspora owczarzaki ATCC 30864]KJE93691.1 hypothetical protein CAOG_004445 [Capsaspora owczarzaki ATCC 30864]|eukprot:XP_004348273.1 hypothetical protein CAOG_04445 [Capsaspora owczarzaki ATCC 30864]